MAQSLPVPVLSDPHWRINIRPEAYNPRLIASLSECFHIVEQTKLSLRGWDYPHLSHRQTERGQGSNWVASWSDFQGRREYWRMYQSGQFLHLFSVEETTNPAWRAKLEGVAKSHLSQRYLRDLDWSSVRGFLSIRNFLYTVTEVFEFAARLCQKNLYDSSLAISIQLKETNGYLLTSEPLRPLWSCYISREDNLGNSWALPCDELVSASADKSLDAVLWFFERFGWMRPPVDQFRQDQANFLQGRL